MNRSCNYLLFIFLLILFLKPVLLPANPTNAESDETKTLLQEKAVKIFLDAPHWYVQYIKTKIPFVNYVRDRKQAEVYVMITRQRTGAGGDEFNIKFIGQNGFAGINDTLKFIAYQSFTEEMTRTGLVHRLKMGLIRYVNKTPLSKFIDIHYTRLAEPTDVIDPWNAWVFTFDIDIDYEGEESRIERDIDAYLSADRVTPASKISLQISNAYRHDRIKNEDGWYNSIRRSQAVRGLYVKSIDDHWSAGGYASAYSSTYSNIYWETNVAPAIEYNVFPYSEYTEREFRFLYRIGAKKVEYDQETIYNKTGENLFYESLSATFELKKRWGSLTTEIRGSHFFHDFSKSRLVFYSNLDFLLFEGFSLDIRGYFSMIRDQLSLPKEGATQEEILLNRRQIATDYQYDISFGIRYTFGSIYSNVVNPRFGG